MASESQKCPNCLKPKSSTSGGLVTQLINVCRCNEIAGTPEGLNQTTFCQSCDKAIVTERPGSLTQWIFESNSCRCKIPIPVETGESSARVNAPAFEIEEDDGVELALNRDSFPFERYQPKMRLGSGASGTVYLSRDRLLGKRVAVKTLHQLTAQQLIAFQEEAKTTSKLNHPNIIGVLDFGPTESGVPYMVLEYIDHAETLDRFIERLGKVDIQLTLRIFRRVCAALAHAHEERIFHRDLKPSNILLSNTVSGELQVKLIDFGVAKLKFETQEPTIVQGQTIVGTPAYMPPELADGGSFDARSEIYSLGCVMFETLTGEPPFVGETALETLAMHANHERPGLSEVAGEDFPEELENAIFKSLARDPSDRFSSAQQMADEIERLAALFVVQEPGSANAGLAVKQTGQPGNYSKRKKPASARSVLLKTGVAISSVLLCSFLGYQAFDVVIQPSPQKTANEYAYKVRRKVSTYDPSKIEKIFWIDPVKKHWIANEPIHDEDLAFAAKFRRGDISCLHVNDGNANNITLLGWSAVASMPLSILSVRAASISDSDMQIFARMKGLWSLNVSATKITDKGLMPLINIPLKSLNLTNCQNLTDRCSIAFRKMKDLEILNTDQTNLGNETLKNLASTKLKQLRMSSCPITDEGMEYLKANRSIRALQVASTGLTVKSFEAIRHLPLEELNVDSCRSFDDRCLSLIAKNCPDISYLVIDNTAVTRKGLKVVLPLKNLRVLHVASLGLKDEDVLPFLNLPMVESINLSENSITDDTVKKLQTVPNIKQVYLSKCDRVSREAVIGLRASGKEVFHNTLIDSPAWSQDAINVMLGN